MYFKKIVLILCIASAGHTASAGWYECYNFKGKIGSSAITLSIQYYDWHYSEPQKKEFNIKGYYKYDNYNEPIKIEGKWNKEKETLFFYELDKENHNRALFVIQLHANGHWNGTWEDLKTHGQHQLHLALVSVLIDNQPGMQFDAVDVLLSASLPDFYFIGTYAKKKVADRAHMTHLKIIRKEDNTVFQTFAFNNYFYEMGNVQTVIYDNVEVVDTGANSLSLWCNAGRMGGFYDVYYDRGNQQFVIAPEPYIEGVGSPDR